jgi:hypothetical protein
VFIYGELLPCSYAAALQESEDQHRLAIHQNWPLTIQKKKVQYCSSFALCHRALFPEQRMVEFTISPEVMSRKIEYIYNCSQFSIEWNLRFNAMHVKSCAS